MDIIPLRLDRVARAVGLGDRDEKLARARLTELSEIAHPGLCVPFDVVREDDAVVVRAPRMPGPALTEAGRCEDLAAWVWLVAGLAEALAALHARGLAHGDVAPANVVVGVHPVLIDLVGPALGRERGTPGFASPERAAGARPSPADDVHALGAVALAAAGDAVRVIAEAWMAPLLAPSPESRPSADAVARGIVRLRGPERWRPAGADDAARAAVPNARTARDPRAWHWRLRRSGWRLAGIATVAAAVIAWAVWGPTSAAEVAARTELPPDPVAAASDLTSGRTLALTEGDGEALIAMTVPGSRAWVMGARDARALDQGFRFAGLTVDVEAADLVERPRVTAAVVDVRSHLSRHLVIRAGEAREVPAVDQRVRLHLEWSGERWRVREVSARP